MKRTKTISSLLCVLTLCLCCNKESCAELYQWTDSDGSVHFSDNPMSVPKGKRPIVRQDDKVSPPPSSRQLSSTSTIQNIKQATQTKEVPESKPQSTINIAAETNKIQAVWSTLKGAILRKDFETASRQFVPALQDQYKAYFMASPREAIARFKEIKFIEVNSIDENYAQGGAIRDDADGTFSYPLNFARGANGDWKVYGM